MAKELVKEWFSHDCGTRNDPDMIPLLEDFRGVGYGIYWSAVELLHERHGSLPLNENTFKAIGKPIGEKAPLVKRVIEQSIDTYGLFFRDGDNFTANRVLKNLDIRQKSSKQKSNAGKASATARQRLLNETSTAVQQNLTDVEQKSTQKGKDSKESKEQKVDSGSPTAPAISFKLLTEDQFYKAIATYKHDFDKDLLRAFFDYWREKNGAGKMRFQLEKTWDLGLRLTRWQTKQFEINGIKPEKLDENGKPKLSTREENDAQILNSVN